MKLKFLSITALLIAVGLATPVRADEVRQTNEQQMVQMSGDRYQVPSCRPYGRKDACRRSPEGRMHAGGARKEGGSALQERITKSLRALAIHESVQ